MVFVLQHPGENRTLTRLHQWGALQNMEGDALNIEERTRDSSSIGHSFPVDLQESHLILRERMALWRSEASLSFPEETLAIFWAKRRSEQDSPRSA